MLFRMLRKIFGIQTFRKKVLVTLVSIFVVAIALSYYENHKLLFDRLDSITNSVIRRNEVFVTYILNMKINNSITVTEEYANNIDVIHALSEDKPIPAEYLPNEYFLKTFDIEYYFILNNQGLPIDSRKYSYVNEYKSCMSAEDLFKIISINRNIVNIEDDKKFFNVYDTLNKKTRNIYFICAIPIYRYDQIVGRFITVTRLNTDIIESLIRTEFSLAKANIKFFCYREGIDSETTVIQNKDSIIEREMAFRDEIKNNIDIFKKHIIYSRFRNNILIRIDAKLKDINSNLYKEIQAAISQFDFFCMSFIVVVMVFVYMSIFYTLNRIRAINKILMYINNLGKIPTQDINIFLEDSESDVSTDDFGVLNKEFRVFLKNYRSLFSEEQYFAKIDPKVRKD